MFWEFPYRQKMVFYAHLSCCELSLETDVLYQHNHSAMYITLYMYGFH
jgi:hypothetical protein